MSPITRRLFLTTLGAGSLGFSRTREVRSFPNWSQDYTDRILTDSPWAKEKSLGFQLSSALGNQSGGPSGARAEIYLTTRWASALPVRQAFALQQFGADGLQDEKAIELLNRNEEEYVIEIAGFPTTIIRQGARRFEAELAKSATLSLVGRRSISPASVHVPEHGMHLMATLRFPRFENLTAKDGEITVYAESGALEIEQRFRLKDMTYEGRLEL
jgi:hypothetical protein